MEIGSQGGGDFDNLTGDIAELVVYNRAMAGSERLGVEEYLGDKYSIQIVPEPSYLMALGLGAAVVLPVLRRRHNPSV